MFIGHNRRTHHKRAPHAFGGIGVLIKESLTSIFEISVLDRSADGILGIQLEDRFTERIYVIFACYLPPDSSPYGKDSDNFFAHLTSKIFTKSYADLILDRGDLNARVGNKNDINTNLSNDTFDIPPRKYLDSTSNKHGSSLIDLN